MSEDPELAALPVVYDAIKDLDSESQRRVLEYVARKCGLIDRSAPPIVALPAKTSTDDPSSFSETPREQVNDRDVSEFDGISPIAIKWMKRNGFSLSQLSTLFSLGTDEIDLVARSVPGSSKNSRVHSVVLLKGIAAYLSSGSARITSEQIKEASLHYDAYDSPNHAKYLKGMSGELGGSKESGFVLNARGLSAATELIKQMLVGSA